MGQRIEVKAEAIGDAALFDLDRSLTGQDGVSFESRPDADGAPPAVLADRLFGSDGEINHVYALSNSVTVTRSGGWTPETLETASDLISNLFIHYAVESQEEREQRLRDKNYNATITEIEAPNPELWIFKVRPDQPLEPFKPGQYTTLALGYWEPRADDAMEDFEASPGLRDKLVRRSYSVSSSMVDENGDLVDPHPEELEFYVVRVSPTEDNIPGLTPRIFMKTAGDRIFLGRKFTGRYTLDGVEPGDTCIFLSTGTGEAPQNQMVAELLRTGHTGKIFAAVCVRYREDLGYTEQNALVQEKYDNYRWMALTTREPETINNKVYIQDLVASGGLEEALGEALDPDNTHVFLCGNPSMIGIPEWDDETDEISFPDRIGVCQLLHERGFTIDRRKHPGNVHYEEYW